MSGSEESRNQCKVCDKPHENLLNFLEKEVENLYNYKDLYFQYHKIESAENKQEDVTNRLEESLKLFTAHETDALDADKAKYYFLKGRLLNINRNYNADSELLLSKAIKLDPKLLPAWNELGDVYWKNNEVDKAINCFEKALKEERNKVSLRNLSSLIRQKAAKTAEATLKNIEKGVTYAKEAVQMDPLDGASWFILGNAHLSAFFGIHQNPKTIKNCLSAYAQAEKDPVASSAPSLHYNKGIALKYEEEFEMALESFCRATQYDPKWDFPKTKESQLIKYLSDINEFTKTSGRMKVKRLNQLINSIDHRQLGPYSGGSYTSSNQTIKLTESSLSDLQTGLNEETVILGKVVCSIHNEDIVPFTFCLVDKLGTCVVVTIYNLAKGKGVIIGDSVAIPEPYVTDYNFNYKTNEYKFRLIRVETPILLVVNSKKVGRDLQAGAQMSTFQQFD